MQEQGEGGLWEDPSSVGAYWVSPNGDIFRQPQYTTLANLATQLVKLNYNYCGGLKFSTKKEHMYISIKNKTMTACESNVMSGFENWGDSAQIDIEKVSID